MRNFIEEKQKTTLDFVQETQYEALDFEFQARLRCFKFKT